MGARALLGGVGEREGPPSSWRYCGGGVYGEAEWAGEGREDLTTGEAGKLFVVLFLVWFVVLSERAGDLFVC